MLRSSLFATTILRASTAFRMRVTRSASRAAAQAIQDLHISDPDPQAAPESAPTKETKTAKRKAAPRTNSRKKARTEDEDAAAMPPPPVPKPPMKHIQPVAADGGTEELVPAELTFSFEDGKKHLISVDPRFEDIFSRLKCRPYEHLERVDPFK